MKKYVDRRTMAVDRRTIGQNGHITARHSANHQMPVAWTDEDAAGNKEIAGARFLNFESAAFIEAFCKHFRKAFRHVLHYQDARRKVRRNLRQNILERVRPAGGNADRDDTIRGKRGMLSLFVLRWIIGNHSGGKFAARGALGDLDFFDQLIGDGIEMSRGSVLRFLNEVDGAESKGLE